MTPDMEKYDPWPDIETNPQKHAHQLRNWVLKTRWVEKRGWITHVALLDRYEIAAAAIKTQNL